MNLMGGDLPRRYKARYAASMAGEIRKNVVLSPGEEVIYSQLVRERRNWLVGQPRMLAITPLRLILVEHNLFSADWILEIPRSAVTDVSREDGALNHWVSFAYSNADETHCVRIQPATRNISKELNAQLFEVLSSFHRGELKPPT